MRQKIVFVRHSCGIEKPHGGIPRNEMVNGKLELFFSDCKRRFQIQIGFGNFGADAHGERYYSASFDAGFRTF